MRIAKVEKSRPQGLRKLPDAHADGVVRTAVRKGGAIGKPILMVVCLPLCSTQFDSVTKSETHGGNSFS